MDGWMDKNYRQIRQIVRKKGRQLDGEMEGWMDTDQIDVEVDRPVDREQEVRDFSNGLNPLRPDHIISNLKRKN